MFHRRATIYALNILVSAGDLITNRWWLRWQKLRGQASVRRYNLQYVASPKDVFIVSYPKSGTTWMQMIVHQLLSDDVDFEHINEVVPFFEMKYVNGDQRVTQIEGPVKSHLDYRQIPKGNGKYIYIYRDGRDVALSYYHHYIRYLFFQGNFDDFFDMFLAANVTYGSWFDHVASWMENKRELDCLFVAYEDLLGDLYGQIALIAEFLCVPVNEKKIADIASKSSFEFMKANERKFELSAGTLPKDVPAFIRKGERGEGRDAVDGERNQKYISECRRKLTGLLSDEYFR